MNTLPKFDLIVTWPRNADYPLWRKFVRDNRAGFKDVFVSIMEPNQGRDYSLFISQAMEADKITLLSTAVKSGQDWRDVAVNEALKYSTADWIWFTEQDFYPLDGFWQDVADGIESGMDVIGVMDGDRLHPCSLMIKRSVLEQTSKDFGIEPGRSDHFGKIQRDLAGLGEKARTGILLPERYTHYAGMSHNWRLISDGQQPNYHRESFLDYLLECLECGIELEPEWKRIAIQALQH